MNPHERMGRACGPRLSGDVRDGMHDGAEGKAGAYAGHGSHGLTLSEGERGMDAQFWIKVWTEGRTAFHQDKVNEKLMDYFPRLNPSPGQKVLVPLCGKSKDLLWLLGLKLRVHGVELHGQAVESFYAENGLSPVEKSVGPDFTRYAQGDLVVSCGDFFKFEEAAAYDFVYDRAALVALPAPMRKAYAKVAAGALKSGGQCLLIVYDYDQQKMEGPPFSVGENEIRELYGEAFDIQVLESQDVGKEGPRFAALGGIRQNCYSLKKRGG
ncbi:MAG: thiopurine S-methyltransferase [bacterium]